MVTTQTQLRRGTDSQCNAMTPVEAEPIVDLTNDRIRIGDGTTLGGIPLPNAKDTQLQSFNFGVAGGTGNALTLTLSPAPTYTQPLRIQLRASANNSGATTINVNGLGPKNILKVSGASLIPLTSGDLVSGNIYEIVYDGTQFQLTTLYSSGLVSVSQGNINTSTGTFSLNTDIYLVSGLAAISSVSSIILPGGQYGFQLESYGDNANYTKGWISGYRYGFGAYTASVTPYVTGALPSQFHTVSGRQRYITASPPYDLGDGEVGGFIFLLLNSSGDIVAHYAADTPPWAYNGKTKITPDYICPLSGKKYINVTKKRSLEEVMDGVTEGKSVKKEITDAIKNADMADIPHPFGKIPSGHRVVLLDPVSDKTERLISFQNNGGSDEVMDAITKGYIKIDNESIKRKCPKSVQACKFKFGVK